MNQTASHQIGQLNEVEQQAVTMKGQGAKNKAIMAATGLNHSQVERAILKATLTQGDVENFEALGTTLADRVKAGRANTLSWGVMGILAGVPESQIRKAWTEITKLESKGVRIGRGGRFAYGFTGQPLYEDTLKPTGTEIPKGAGVQAALKLSRVQRIARMTMDDLKVLGEQVGVEFKKGNTKASYAKKVAQALVTELGEQGADEITADEA